MRPEMHFVYCPRSGSRWLPGAEPRGGVAIPIVEWPNGSAHVVGGRASVFAAAPRRHWRDRAGELAVILAREWAGVAWDDHGEVSVVVPVRYVRFAQGALWLAQPLGSASAPDTLVATMIGLPAREVEYWRRAAEALPPGEWFAALNREADFRCQMVPEPRWVYTAVMERDQWSLHLRCGDVGVSIRAPSDWGHPTVMADREPAEEIPHFDHNAGIEVEVEL